MEETVLREFFDFFQDFVNLCQAENWPNNTTTDIELRNAFKIAQHIEKCLEKLQKRNLLNEFLSTLYNYDDKSCYFLKNCFADSTKAVLKKIIVSDCSINQIDISLNIYIEIFDEDKLVECLSDIMLETASKRTLLDNLPAHIPNCFLLELKSQIFLYNLSTTKDSKMFLEQLLTNCNNSLMEILVVSLLSDNHKHDKEIVWINEAFINVMLLKNQSCKSFWKSLFNVDEKYFIQLCISYTDLFKCMVETLIDIAKLLKNNMSLEYFYLELPRSELSDIIKRIMNNDILKEQFLSIINENNLDVGYWDSIGC